MREVISIFSEQDTRDELGIGGVHDSFSATLFPGTSTIQTRPRYFFLVPWVYRRLEAERVPSARAAAKARQYEVELIYALLRGGEHEGVLGREAKDTLLRLPSAVYWGGLHEFGIRLFRGSIDDYHRSLDGYHRNLRATLRAESEELNERASPNWHAGLPDPPDGLFEETTISLRRVEADFLEERITSTHGESMLALMIRGKRLAQRIRFPWDYPHLLPESIRNVLVHARAFSEVMHGAALLYNLLLAKAGIERFGGDRYKDRLDRYVEALDEWALMLEGRASELDRWDRADMWDMVEKQNPRISPRARRFVDDWIGLALDNAGAVATGERPADLIRSREHQLKGGSARLRNSRHLEMWNGAAGTGRLDFRWPTARTLVRDVQKSTSNAGS